MTPHAFDADDVALAAGRMAIAAGMDELPAMATVMKAIHFATPAEFDRLHEHIEDMRAAIQGMLDWAAEIMGRQN